MKLTNFFFVITCANGLSQIFKKVLSSSLVNSKKKVVRNVDSLNMVVGDGYSYQQSRSTFYFNFFSSLCFQII
jgi:alkaline phosphatase